MSDLADKSGQSPRTYLSLLFRDTDHVASPNLPELFRALSNPGELFCVNPLDGATDHEPTRDYHRHDKPRRADMNVTVFRNFIFESDSAPLENQMAAIRCPAIAEITRLAVFSGNKSVSLIISVADTLPFQPHTDAGIWEYKAAWEALKEHIEGLTGIVMDPSTKNPSRLTRTPLIVRESTGKVQEVLHTGALVTAEFVLGLMHTKIRRRPTTIAPMNASSYEEFSHLLRTEQVLKGLKNKLQNSYSWAGHVNMYPEIIRLSLWAIDATNPPLDVLRAYMWEHTFPALLAAGYDRDKIEEGLINAYKYKGLL